MDKTQKKDMSEEKKYTKEELLKKLTGKEKKFCHEYVIDWNGARAARAAGYSENSARHIADQNLSKLHIKQYIAYIRDDYELLCGISKAKLVAEYSKIAFCSISHLHNTWIDLKAFDLIPEHEKEAIESIETKTERRLTKNVAGDMEPIEVKMVKIKLYPKLQAIEGLRKLMGYDDATKLDLSSKDGSMSPTKPTAEEIRKIKEGLDESI